MRMAGVLLVMLRVMSSVRVAPVVATLWVPLVMVWWMASRALLVWLG